MINYLNCTKRLFVALTTTTALAGSLSLVSCQDYDNGFDEKKIIEKEFSNNFIKYFGEVDPNHSWGFEDMPSINSSFQSATRAGFVDVNTNEWDAKYSQSIHIPGWPNFDGYYYASDGNTAYFQSKDKPTGDWRPTGDVTEYEIQFVSNWFRSHEITDPTQYREELHLSDFFIQNVSVDNDQIEDDGIPAYPNGRNKTKAEANESTFQMDHLHFKTMSSTGDVENTWTHVNNFNNGNSNYDPEHNTSNINRTIQYITSSGTEDFAYHPSHDTKNNSERSISKGNEGNYYNDWVLVHLEWDEVGLDGISHRRDGYYLAFDYEAYKDDGKDVNRDHYYSNWIVKITPAHFKPNTGWPKRIMCEDLGNTLDYDFNDVVFDVVYDRKTGYSDEDPNATFEAVITLQAAGGTLPIYIGVEPTDENSAYEAHKMLGQSTHKVPVNVGKNSVSHGISIYRVNTGSSHNPNDIKIYVHGNNGVNYGHTGDGTYKDYYQISQANKGTDNTPQKFAVPNTVKWMMEEEFIDTGYPEFKNWVKNESGNPEWYKNPAPGAKICGIVGDQNIGTGNLGGTAISGDAILLWPFSGNNTSVTLEEGATLDLRKYVRSGLSSYSIAANYDNTIVSISDEKILTANKAGQTIITMESSGMANMYREGSIQITIFVKEPFIKEVDVNTEFGTELNNSFTNQYGQMRLSVDASLFTDMTSETLPSNLIFSFVLESGTSLNGIFVSNFNYISDNFSIQNTSGEKKAYQIKLPFDESMLTDAQNGKLEIVSNYLGIPEGKVISIYVGTE